MRQPTATYPAFPAGPWGCMRADRRASHAGGRGGGAQCVGGAAGGGRRPAAVRVPGGRRGGRARGRALLRARARGARAALRRSPLVKHKALYPSFRVPAKGYVSAPHLPWPRAKCRPLCSHHNDSTLRRVPREARPCLSPPLRCRPATFCHSATSCSDAPSWSCPSLKPQAPSSTPQARHGAGDRAAAAVHRAGAVGM